MLNVENKKVMRFFSLGLLVALSSNVSMMNAGFISSTIASIAL